MQGPTGCGSTSSGAQEIRPLLSRAVRRAVPRHGVLVRPATVAGIDGGPDRGVVADLTHQGVVHVVERSDTGAGAARQRPARAVVRGRELAEVRRTGYSLMMQREPAGLGEAWRQRGLH